MANLQNNHRIWLKAVAIVVIEVFLFGQIAWAFDWEKQAGLSNYKINPYSYLPKDARQPRITIDFHKPLPDVAPDTPAISARKDKEGNTLIFHKGRLNTKIDKEGNKTIYDIRGGRARSTVDKNGKLVAKYSHDRRGRLSKLVDGEDNVTRYFYGRENRVEKTTETDVAGKMITRYFDFLGQVNKLIDKEGKKFDYSYDDEGNLIKSIETDTDGKFIVRDFNPVGQLTKLQDKDNRVFEYEYDYNNRVKKLTSYSLDNAEDETTLEYEHNSEGKITKTTETDKDGKTEIKWFNDQDLAVKVKDKDGKTTEYTYGEDNKITKSVEKYLDNKTIVREFDQNGNVAKLIDKEGIIYVFERDAEGNVAKSIETDKDNKTIIREFDAEERLIKLKKKDGTLCAYKYDAKGNIIEYQETYTDNKTLVKYYDEYGKLTKVKDKDGDVWTYAEKTAAEFVVTNVKEAVTKAINEGTLTILTLGGLGTVTGWLKTLGNKIFNCAVNALFSILAKFGIYSSRIDLATSLIKRGIMAGLISEKNAKGELQTSMHALVETAKEKDLTLYGAKIDLTELAKASKKNPIIAHQTTSDGLGHFVVVTKVDTDNVTYIDTDSEEYTVSISEWLKTWTKNVLLVKEPGKDLLLDDAELKKIKGTII